MSEGRSSKKNAQLITEELFREAYQYEEGRKPQFKTLLARSLRCTKQTPLNFFPFAKWIVQYSYKNDLLGDIIAGVTVAIMHVPHGLAYAPLGRMEPVVGFYMALFPVIIYMFLGTSRHISIGTFAVVCAMVGEVVLKNTAHEDRHSTMNATHLNFTTRTDELATNKTYSAAEIGTSVCLMVGIWQAGLGLLKLGSLTVILSESLVSGFTTGAAIHVLSYQLRNLFGVNVATPSGVFKLIYIYIDFFRKIRTVNIATMCISIVCIGILLLFNEFLKPLIQKKFPKNKIPIPIELIVVIIGILASYFGRFEKNFHVKVVGHIPKGFPHPAAPPASAMWKVILDSFVIALVALIINLSLARIFAKKANYVISSNQEFFAYGIANIFSSFFCCLPSAASLSRSTIQYAVGGRTQLASLFSMFIITLVLLFAGFMFEPVPYCVLSSIVVVSLKGLLMQMCDLCKIWRESYLDGIVWIGTFLAVVILDLDIGLGVGILLSILTIVFGSFSFQVAVLGRVSNTNIYLDMEHYKSAQPVPNVVILQITGNLNFTNSNHLEKAIRNHCNNLLVSEQLVLNKQSYVILNMSAVSRIDPTSINTLRVLYKFLKKYQCELFVTDCNIVVYRTFEICNLYKDFPKDQVLASVSDAVDYINAGGKQ